MSDENGNKARIDENARQIQVLFRKVEKMDNEGTSHSKVQDVKIEHIVNQQTTQNETLRNMTKQVQEVKTKIAQGTTIVAVVLVVINIILRFV